jgi:retinoid hydroxylase
MADKLKSADMMPGSFGLPIIGELIGFLRKREEFYWQKHQDNGNIFKTSSLVFGKAVCLVGPAANRLVLKDGVDKMSSRLGNKFLEPIVSTDTVLLQDGEEHRTSRKLILPLFHHQAIASYFDTIQSVVNDAMADWGDKGTIDLSTELRKITLTVVVKIFLGSEKTEEIDRVSEWFTTLVDSERSSIVKWDNPLTAYGRGQAARRKIVDYIRQVIQERAARGDLDQSTDVLSLLLNTVDEDGNKFTEMQVVNQAIGLLFAGSDTSSSLLSWLLFELGNRPEWRQRLREEQQQVMGNEPISMSHLRQLPNLTNAIKEGERLYPPAFAISRMAIADIEYGGYLIPAGWFIFIFPMITHRLPEIYQDPDAFDPDRFAPPREEDKKQPYSLIGFGGGVHSCIGVELAQMEMKIILSTLLQKYDWTVTPTTAEIAPVRRPVTMQKQLKAKFVPINPLQGGVPEGWGG